MNVPSDPDWHSIPGWWSDACALFYWRAVQQAPPAAHFVEVGSWLGRSAASMAGWIRDSGREDIRFTCVDHWQGTSVEGDAGFHQRLIREQGLNLREAFEKNLGVIGLRPYVGIEDGDSVEVAERFSDRSLDLVMIDGDHRTEMVERDCRAWLPKLRYGGLLCGHDANAERVLAGVRAAGIEPEVDGQMWWWRKRLPVTVLADSPLLAGAIVDGSELEAHFGSRIARGAREVLPRYFDRRDVGVTIGQCEEHPDANVVLCPHDAAHPADYKRSAHLSKGERVFPAFPHGDWPFLDPAWEPPAVRAEGVGFCGIARPEIRRAALDALRSSGLDHQIIERERFFGQDVPREQARREYLEVLTANVFQLCVRGAGNYCYRLYETLAAGRVPILVNTDRPLPWEGVLPWETMAVILRHDELASMGERVRLRCTGGDLPAQCRRNRKLWLDYLSPIGWWREWARRQ